MAIQLMNLYKHSLLSAAIAAGLLMNAGVGAVENAGTAVPKIVLEGDLALDRSVSKAKDLPEQITVNFFKDNEATSPVANQSFARGEYSALFPLMRSDGLTASPAARFRVAVDASLLAPYEVLFAEFVLDGVPRGERRPVPVAQLAAGLSSDGSPDPAQRGAFGQATGVSAGSSSDNVSAPLIPISAVAPESGPNSSLPLSGSKSAITKLAGSWSASGSTIYYVDGKVGLGTSAPSGDLDVYGPNYTQVFFRTAHDLVSSALYFQRARGTKAAPTDVTAAQELGEVVFEGYSSAYGGYMPPSATITVRAGTIQGSGTSSWLPGWFYFYTVNNAGVTAPRMVISPEGKVGINTENVSNELTVNGTILSKKIVVDSSNWADYVFESGYKRLPLDQLEGFIAKNRHLPGMPTASEVEKEGVDLSRATSKLLEKVEELTLYVIDLKRENEELRQRLDAQQAQR